MSRSKMRAKHDPFEGVTGKDRERLNAFIAWRDQTPQLAPRSGVAAGEPSGASSGLPRAAPSRKRGRRFSVKDEQR